MEARHILYDHPIEIPETQKGPPGMNFKDIWPFIREKFPPARAVAFLTPVVLPLIAMLWAWLVDHLPLIAEQTNQTAVTATFISILAGGIALAYKWLDGRAKWETQQVAAQTSLVINDIDPHQEATKAFIDQPPAPAESVDQTEPDAALVLSQPDEIDSDDLFDESNELNA